MDRALERQTELAQARAAYDDARHAVGTLLLVTGPAGVGKSTLLDAYAEEASGLRPLRARCDELAAGLPFGVVRQLFERLLRSDAALADRVLLDAARVARAVVLSSSELSPVSPQEASYALTWLVANLAAEQPLLLTIDDVTWIDDASLRWLRQLAGRLDELPVVVALAMRTGEDRCEDALTLLDTPRAAEVPLAPLSGEAVARLVRAARGGDVDDAVCAACRDVTAGNPFLVHELLRSLRDLPRLEVADVTAARPSAVARSVGRRLGALSREAQLVAEAVAVVGDEAELRHVAALAGIGVDAAAVGADELADRGILTPARPLRFVHPLVRTAVHDRLGAQTRAHAHAAAARTLAAEGADTQRVAQHLLLAPPLGDPWAAGQLLAAGATALRGGAAREAHALLERALLEPPPASVRPTVELALAQAELCLLDARAEQRLQHVVTSTDDPRLRAEALVDLTTVRTLLGVPPEPGGVDDLAAELGSEDRELALDLRAAGLMAGLVQYAAVPDAGDRVERLAAGLAGDTPAERRLLGALAYHLVVQGETSGERCADLAERAFGRGLLVEESGDTTAAWQTALALLVTGRHDTAHEAVRVGLRRATARSSEVTFATWSIVGCYGGWLTGRLEEAEAHGRGAWRAGRESGLWLPRVAAAAYLSRVLAERDQLDEADALLDEVAGAGPPGSIARDTVDYSSILLRLEQGRWGDVVALGRGIAERVGGATNPGVLWRPPVAIALARRGDRAAAERLLAEQRAADARWGIPRVEGVRLLAEALVLTGAEGLARAEQASVVLAEAEAPLELARCLLAQGRLLRHDRQRAAAREVLVRALDVADRCGALRLVHQVEEEIGACGGSLPRRRRSTGVHALTPSELRVARLAAEGMTNSEIAQSLFVTRKTVEAHLAQVFRKLEIPSRHEIAAELAADLAAR